MSPISDDLPVYWRYWGKTAGSEGMGVHLLPFHLLDVAAVAHQLLRAGSSWSRQLSALSHLCETEARALLVHLCALHDIGKFAESFQSLRPDLRQHYCPDQHIERTEYRVRHDTLCWLLWDQSLGAHIEQTVLHHDDTYAGRDALDIWMQAVSGHHGVPPAHPAEPVGQHFSASDIAAAVAFFDDWHGVCPLPVEAILAGYCDRKDTTATDSSWLLAGLLVLADWLGSNSHFFPMRSTPMPMAEYWTRHALPSARRAVESTGLFNAHSAGTQRFEQLFPGFAPTPLQHHCDSVTPADGPQLFILEDATGAGKTEAAMTLVHRLMQTTGASGVYVGLPSMATANAMYSRMAGVYRSLFSESSSPSLVLSHGARHLSQDFQQALFNALPANASYGTERASGAQCNFWLADSRKKCLLADVGVGTIDQALLAVMPARHQSLRLLGLAGHVLVLDEVHAYDHYTRELLYRLLAFHAALGGSTVLLSATLTAAQKVAMARAVTGPREQFAIDRDAPYPLVTHVSADGLAQHPVATRPEVTREVRVVFVHGVDTALEQVVAAAARGACVCWVRNTVDEARAAWQALQGVAGVDTGRLHLFHSRFAFADRLAIEMQLQGWFGPDSNADDRRGRILVATQVVEQSLDLDFDHFLSDLAPIDLLVQRAGRLQRHTRSLDGDRASREARDTAQLTVLAPPWTDTPDENWLAAFSRGSHAVYPETHVLWQSAQWLRAHGGWRMPGDARALLEHAYATDNLPPGLQGAQLKSEGEAKGQRDMGQWSALTFEAGYCRTSAWDEEARVETRLGDDNTTVYLARWDGTALRPWANATAYPWDMSSLKLRTATLKALTWPDGGPLAAALKQLVADTDRLDEYTCVLPLVESETGEWTVVLDSASGATWHYTPQDGLRTG